MDGPVSTQYQPALADFSGPHQQRLLQSLTLLATRHSTAATLAAVIRTRKALRCQVTGARQRVLTADLTQTTAQDIVACIATAQASGLAPSTIKTTLGLLTAFFAHLRDEGQMTQQPVRRRPRLLTPTVWPTPMPARDRVAFFQVLEAVRDRLICLVMVRCG